IFASVLPAVRIQADDQPYGFQCAYGFKNIGALGIGAPACFTNKCRRPYPLHQGMYIGDGMVAVQRRAAGVSIARACEPDNSSLDTARCPQAHALTRAYTTIVQANCKRICCGHQIPIAQPAITVPYGITVGSGLGLNLRAGIDRFITPMSRFIKLRDLLGAEHGKYGILLDRQNTLLNPV